MEVYTLDEELRRKRVYDRFESFIWTERFQSAGDFEMVIRSTPDTRGNLYEGVQLAMNESYTVMTIETVEDSVNSSGEEVLKINGVSLEAILNDRVAFISSTVQPGEKPTWDIVGTPMHALREIFSFICVQVTNSNDDLIPFIKESWTDAGFMLEPGTIPPPVDPIELSFEPKSVYDITKSIAEVWGLGFRLLRNFDYSELWYDIYTGSDRSSSQTINDPVIFSPDLDNLQDTKMFKTIAGSKNVALVFTGWSWTEVWAEDYSPEITGFNRRALYVDALDIAEDNPNAQALIKQRGKEALSEHRPFQAFDGEVSQNSPYKYGVDYFLGDVVEMRNVDGVSNRMRVTEQIFVSDGEGERKYPTLTLSTFVNTGSWLSWESNKQWADYENDPTTWSEQP